MRLEEICVCRSNVANGFSSVVFGHRCEFMRSTTSVVGAFQNNVMDGSLFKCDSLTGEEKGLAAELFRKLLSDKFYEIGPGTLKILKVWNEKIAFSNAVKLRRTVFLTAKTRRLSAPKAPLGGASDRSGYS